MLEQKTKNKIAVLQAVALYGQKHGWDWKRARRMGRAAIMCVSAEGGGQMYANTGVPSSLKIPHDGRLYTVVFTWRGDRRRFISVRRSNPSEARTYGRRTSR